MAMDYDVQKFEYNGGMISYYKVPTPYVDPVFSDYTQFGGTQGISLEVTTEMEEVDSDQSLAPTDIFRQSISAKVVITLQETDLEKMIMAMGGDISTILTGQTIQSVLRGAASSGMRTVSFGGINANQYFDLQFEKLRSHDTSKLFGYRLYKATPTGNMTFNAKVKEKNFWDIEFTCLASNESTHGGAIGMPFDEA